MAMDTQFERELDLQVERMTRAHDERLARDAYDRANAWAHAPEGTPYSSTQEESGCSTKRPTGR